MVVLLAVLCAGRRRRCRPGIWCYNDETRPKVAQRADTHRSVKWKYRRLNGVKKGDTVNSVDLEREFEDFFDN